MLSLTPDIAATEARPGAIRIEPGACWRGSRDDEEGFWGDRPRHRVRITRPFWMAMTPVTQPQYIALMGHNPSRIHRPVEPRPIDSVTWYDAIAYCNAASRADGLPEAYAVVPQGGLAQPHVFWHGLEHPGWRLSTEAEWEYAARAGLDDQRYGPVDEVAWHRDNCGGTPRLVGQKRPNPWGLYDMLGNVAEWMWDAHVDYFDPLMGLSSRWTVLVDPFVSGLQGSRRVCRGGSWAEDPAHARAANRFRDAPGNCTIDRGFRIVRTALQA